MPPTGVGGDTTGQFEADRRWLRAPAFIYGLQPALEERLRKCQGETRCCCRKKKVKPRGVRLKPQTNRRDGKRVYVLTGIVWGDQLSDRIPVLYDRLRESARSAVAVVLACESGLDLRTGLTDFEAVFPEQERIYRLSSGRQGAWSPMWSRQNLGPEVARRQGDPCQATSHHERLDYFVWVQVHVLCLFAVVGRER